MKTRLFLVACLSVLLSLASCDKLSQKKYDFSKPVDVIEALGNDISASSDEWTNEEWDDAADALETALKNLPDQLADDESTLVSSTISRMSVYAERHKRKAGDFLELVNNYLAKNNEAAPAAPAEQPQQAAAAPAPAPAPAPVPAPAPAPVQQQVVVSAPAGLLSGHVIREGGYTNVRQGPGTNYAIVNKIKDGSPSYYTVYDSKWCVVYDSYGNAMGYMHSSKVIPSTAARTVSPSSGVAYGTPYDWLSQRYATARDLNSLNLGQLRILRNSIYARHGRKFQDAGLR